MAQVGLRLEIMDSDVNVCAPLHQMVPLETRALVEEELGSLRLLRDIIYPEHERGADAGTPGSEQWLSIASRACIRRGQVLQRVLPTSAGEVKLASGQGFGRRRVSHPLRVAQGQPTVHRASFEQPAQVTPVAAPQAMTKTDERRRRVLEHYERQRRNGHSPHWTPVARYALGQYERVDESAIRWTCEFIAGRNDCARLCHPGILRLMFWERQERHLSQKSMR